jgi:uncharacterized phage protein (TIGR02220 family)
MSILRVEKNANYTVINRTALNDTRLSWKAKGIISYMLSMPDDWVFYTEELVSHAKDKEKSFRSGFKELKENGYVKRFPVYNEEKKIDHWETVVYEVPQGFDLLSQNLQVGNLQVEKLHVENEGLLSTDLLLSTDTKLNTDSKIYSPAPQDNLPYGLIVDYLNTKAKTNYKPSTKKTQALIKARYNEGFTLEDFKQVIDKKTNEWLRDSKMNRYLRPETLFGTKFESYLNQKEGNSGKAEAAKQFAEENHLPF